MADGILITWVWALEDVFAAIHAFNLSQTLGHGDKKKWQLAAKT